MADLKPCPFCGGEAHLRQDASHSKAWFIGCNTEDCFGEIHWAQTKAEAITAWNTRADPVLTDPRVLALVEALRDIAVMGYGDTAQVSENIARMAVDGARAALRAFTNKGDTN